MKTSILRTPTILFALIALPGSVLSQTQQVTASVAQTVSFEILEQPGCPVAISADHSSSLYSLIAVRLTNSGDQSVVAYVMRAKSKSVDHAEMVLVRSGIAPGKVHVQSISGAKYAQSKGEIAVLSLDYVEFADGSGWGEDKLGKSKQIAEFNRGRQLAITRLKSLIGNQDRPEILKLLTVTGSSGFGAPVSAREASPASVDFFGRGYEEIIKLLRSTAGKRVDESLELARKLEVMEIR